MSISKVFAKLSPENAIQVTVDNLMGAMEEGYLIPYEHNRGTIDDQSLVVNTGVLKSMKTEGFTSAGFGTITVGLFGDFFKICDGHSRLAAVKNYLNILQKTTDNEKEDQETRKEAEEKYYSLSKCRVLVKAVTEEDFLDAYGKLNSGKIHSGSDKIRNVDFVAGAKLHKFLKKAEALETLPTSLWQPLYHILYAFEVHGEGKFTSKHVYTNTNKAEKLKCVPVTKYVKAFTKDATTPLEEGLKFYLELQSIAKVYTPKNASKNIIGDILRGVGLFTFIMVDFANTHSILRGKSAKRILSLIDSKNALDIRLYCSNVSRRHGDAAIMGYAQLEDTFSAKRRQNI